MAKASKEEPVLPVGATHFLPSEPGERPEPIPKGVSIRSNSSVQVEFMWEGRRCTESLPGKPTESAVRKAVRKRESVLEDIEYNRFVYDHHFPNSRRVKRKRAEAATAQRERQKTMDELLEDWLDRYQKEHPDRGNTIDTHREVIRSRLKPALGRLTPAEISTDTLVEFRHGLFRESLSVSRVSNIMTPLNGTLDLAVERGLMSKNPCRDLAPTKPKATNKVVLDESGSPLFDEPLPTSLDPAYINAAKNADPLDADERKSVLARMLGQIRNIFLFAMWTGLRTGELIALRWCDVSADGRRILVRLSFSKSRFTNTKGRRARWVDLTGPAIAALQAQRQITGVQGRWVFHNPLTGDRWQNSQRLRVRWIRALKAAGVRYRKPYQCRHTYASMMVSAGESPEWVAEQMGHLDGRLVSAVYGRWLRPADVRPGQAAAQVYAREWEEAGRLVAFEDVVPAEDDDGSNGDLALAGDDQDEEQNEL
jgi:integrase